MNTDYTANITEIFYSVDEFCKQIEQQFKKKAIGKDGKKRFIRHLEWCGSKKKKTAEQIVYLNKQQQMYSYEQQFSISCLGIVSPQVSTRGIQRTQSSYISKVNELRNAVPSAVMPIW